ncbi:MAG: YlxR family protein [Pseudonocardiaceae bacterium]
MDPDSLGRGPVRTCVGCCQRANVEGMVRVVAGPNASAVVGRALPGRGAWLCAGSPACIEAAVRKSAIGRALRTNIAPGSEAALQTMLASRESMEEVPLSRSVARGDEPAKNFRRTFGAHGDRSTIGQQQPHG